LTGAAGKKWTKKRWCGQKAGKKNDAGKKRAKKKGFVIPELDRIIINRSLLIYFAAIAPSNLVLLSPPSADISANISLCPLPFTVNCRLLLFSAFFLCPPFNASCCHHRLIAITPPTISPPNICRC
jgi:hypothetical protein